MLRWILAIVLAMPSLSPAAAPADATRPVLPRGPLAADERALIELFERARDAVVFISTRAQVRDFWSRNVFSVPRGTGSGFLWDEAGHVVTNFHVVEGASEATIRMADGTDHRANLVGASPTHDLAVLRIGIDLRLPPPLPLGSSSDLRVGQRVYAIGNPFGLDWTLTSGIVSALDRSLDNGQGLPIQHLIETDAAINHGNSGGPLLDSAGRLIGINTAIYSPSGASAGIGFAVPVDTVNRVVPQLIRHGRYLRPSLGIEVDEDLNRRLKVLLKVRGAVVLRAAPGSAAAEAGLRGVTVTREGRIVPGDVIVAVDGKPVDGAGKLLARLDDYQVGDRVILRIERQGQTQEVAVTLREAE
jgi:S1-C subfamily serine protease